REHIERLVHVAVFPDRCAGRIEIIVETGLGRALAQFGSFEGPRDEVEPHRLKIFRKLRRNDLTAADREQRRHRGSNDLDLALTQLREELQLLPTVLDLLA